MKKINVCFLALALACAVSVAQAGTIRLAGDVGVLPPTQTSGVIQVLIDLEPGQTMSNGGIVMDVLNANPSGVTGGAVAFSDATVLNPSGRWTIATDVTTPAAVAFNTSSFATAALPAGGQGVLFATINWQKVGSGRSDLSFGIGPEAFVDGNNGDVTSQYVGVPNFISFVPEPTSLVMGGMCLVGLALRRRNG